MPIDVSKIQPKAKSRDEVIDSIVGGVFKEPESGVADSLTGTGDRSGSGYVGKMSYPYDGKDLIVDVTDEIDGDGNTMVRDEGGNVLQVKAKDLKALPDGGSSGKQGEQQEAEREPGFWNTMVGDFIEKFGAGAYKLNGGLWSIANLLDKGYTAVNPVSKYLRKVIERNYESKHPGEKYKSYLEKQRDFSRDYSETLSKRGDRYNGKDFKELWKGGDYTGAVGEIFYTASESIPQSAVAMAGGGWGLLLMGATSAADKYDQLDAMPEAKDMPEATKIFNAVCTGTFEAMFEKLGDAAIGREFKRLIFHKGKDVVDGAFRSNLENWIDGMFKRYGLLFAPVSEGIEEVGTQICQNITDYSTGVTDEWNPMDGVWESFVYGMAGGAQFSMAGAPLVVHNKVMKRKSRRGYEDAKADLGKRFEGDEGVESFANGIAFMSPAEQEAVLGGLARSGEYTQEQVNSMVDYVNKANRYKAWNDPKVTEATEAAKKELEVRAILREFDETMTPHVNEAGMIQQVVVAGMSEPVYVVKGDVIADEYGIVDAENSSQELYYQDADGKMQVVTPGQIDRVELLIDVAEMRSTFENQLRHPEEYVQPEQSQTDEEGVKDDSGIENGERIVYKDEAGNEKEGVVSDAYSDAEHVFVQDGDVVPRGNVIGKTERAKADVQEQEAETPVEVPHAPGFEIEKGVKAVKQEDRSYALDKVFSKSEREKAEKYVERLNQDYEDEGVTWKLVELPKSDPDNRLEKKMYGVVGRVEEVVPVENKVADVEEESIPEKEADESVKNENKIVNPIGISLQEAIQYYEKVKPVEPNIALYFKIGDEYFVLNEDADRLADLKGVEAVVTPEGVRCVKVNFIDDAPLFIRELGMKPEVVDRKFYDKVFKKRVRSNKKKSGEKVRDEAVVPEEPKVTEAVSEESIAHVRGRISTINQEIGELQLKKKKAGNDVSLHKVLDGEIASWEKDLKQYQAILDKFTGEAEKVKEAKPVVGGFGSENKIITKDRYEELKRQWKEKTRGQLNVGFDPELLSIGTQMAMFHIEAGARKFADFAESMIEDIGVNIKPYLKSIYEGARYMPGMENVAKDMDKPDIVAIFSLDYMGVSVEEFDKDIAAIREEKKQEKPKEKKKVSFSDVLEKKIKERGWGVSDVVEDEIPKSDGEVPVGVQEVEKEASEGEGTGDWIIGQVKYPTQSYSTEGVEMDYPSDQVGKWVKKDAAVFVRALGEVLGWEHEHVGKGKSKNDVFSVNIAPAGGDVGFTLWKPGTDAGVYVRISYECDYSAGGGYDNYRPEAEFLWRVTTKANKSVGLKNNYHSIDATTGELAELFSKAVNDFLRDNDLKVDDNGQESGRNQDRGLPDRGGVSEDQVDAGLHTARNVPDVSGEQTERISDAGGRQSDGYESHADGIGHESVGSKRDDERYRALPDWEQLQVDESIDDGTDRGDRGVPEHGDPVKDRGEKGSNYVIEDPEHIVPGGKVGKLRANIAAIRLLKQLEKEGRTATGDEQKRLSQYSGWGGLAEVLNKDKANIEGWEKEYGNFHRELMGLLTEDEYISAVNSTINAHYTAGHVVNSLWELAERLGFRGGKILEPAAGSGNFIGLMPSHLAERSGVVAYELDSLTGRILSYLYPEANVKVAGYETSKDRAFDLVITNVPFGQTAPYDPANKELSKFNLHNYFIAKGIRQLKPGGLGIFLTSYTSMDNGAGASFREWVGSEGNADFIGAIRLPNNAFSDNAGTEVTTDVLVFRKRDVNGVSPYAQPFRYALPVKETKTKEGKVVTIDVNEYFVNHPDMMLGEPFLAYQVNRGGLYSGDDFTLQARKGEDLRGALKGAIEKFASDVSNIEATPEGRVRLADNGEKEGSLIFRDGMPYEVQGGELVVPEWAGQYTTTVAGKRVARKEVARQYVELRETVNQLVDSEVSEGEGIDELRRKLNDLYDGFVKNFGPLSRNLKLRFLKESDMEWGSVFGLEEEKQTFEEDGKGGYRKAYFIQKAEIFSKRVSFPVTEPTEASSLEDAIHISGAYRGHLDLDYVASLLGITEEAAKEKILNEGLGFENPATGLVEDRDTYLSKFVRKKLAEARVAAEADERFKSNVEALEKVIPADIPPSLVRFNLGTTFIPGTFVERFVKEKLEVDATIRYVPSVNRWLITNVSNAKNPKNETTFGTKRIAGLDLVEKGLNMQTPLIYDTWEDHGHKVREKNEEGTIAAQAKLMEIKDAFVDFVSGNEEMMQELAQLYNEEYNGYIEKKYSVPAFKHYPGASTDIELRQHQKSAIPRILEGCVLLGHQVGSGKTFTIITGAMEMRRLKLAKKPMIVVQNQTLEQFVGSFKRLYPGAKLLAPTKGQMDAKNRVRLLNMISYGDYDAIIVPQSFVPMIPDNEERQKAYIKEQIAELESVLSEVDPESEKSLYSQLTAQLEGFQDDLDGLDNQDAEGGEGDKKGKKAEVVKTKAKRQLGIVKRISRQMDRKTDNIRTFEQLGVDALFVDEAHAYKKLGLVTKLANVRGIDKGGSKRAFSMYMKVRHIQEATGGKNVVFATGTPITNTMAELWTMMRYLAPDILKLYNIERFDEFASTFGSIEPSLEFTAAGNFKVVDRFKSYVNAPELMMAFRAFTDIVLSQDIPEFQDGKTLPKLKNGEFTQIIIKQSDGLKAVMVDLRKELTDWEKLSGKEKRKKRHIPLVVFNKAKQAAIDLRLLDPNFADDPDSKTNRVVKEVYRIYQESDSYKGTQLVFSDMYQSPDKGNKFGRFNLYQDIKKKLVMLGIPEREIAIINDYKDSKREMLFEQMKTGEVRVLIGGTEKMGIGVNVQERLVAVHHVDAPPRPMDFEQRNGRIVRQGNIHAEMGIPIEVLTYGVEKTLDATAYQRLMIKQGFINQMMKGDNLGREMEDYAAEDDASDLNFSQMMATLSGSQYAMLHQQRSFELKKLEMAEKNHERRLIELNKDLQNSLSLVDYYVDWLSDLSEGKKFYEKYFPDGKVKSVKIGDKVYSEKLGEVLGEYFQKVRESSLKKAKKLDYYFDLNGCNRPVKICLSSLLNPDYIDYDFFPTEGKNSSVCSSVQSGQGFITSFSRLIGNVIDEIKEAEERQKHNDERIPVLKEELKKPFDKTERLEALRKEVEEIEELMQKEVINETGVDHKAIEARDAEENETGVKEDINEIREDVPVISDVTADAHSVASPAEYEGELALPVTKTKHTKTGADLFVVKMRDRVGKDVFGSLKRTAKDCGGGWSNFTKGFNFSSEEKAEKFRASVNGVTPESEDVLFREVNAPGMRGERARIEREVMRLEKALKVRVKRVRSRDDLPERIRKMMSTGKRYPGVYSGKDGCVYVVLDEVLDVAEAQRAVLHEVVGHKGIRALFGGDMKRFSDLVLASMSESDREAYLKRYKNNREVAAQEFVAGFAERYSDPAVWERIKGFVRDCLRRMGVNLKLSDGDLMYLLWRGVRQIREGDGALEVACKVSRDYALFKEAEDNYSVNMEVVSEVELDDADRLKLHNEVASRRFQFLEAYQDRMLAVKNFQELIEQKLGRNLPDYMNAYLFENTLASRNTYETEHFRNTLLRPLTQVLATLEGRGLSRRPLENYVMAKHGLERNEYMRAKRLEEWYEPLASNLEAMKDFMTEQSYEKAREELEEMRELKEEQLKDADFSGLSAVVKELPDEDVNAFIQEIENVYGDDISRLWECIRRATEFSVRKWYECGNMTKGNYEKVKGMYKHYVPLRQFDETIASDVYEYFDEPKNGFNSPLRRANGRNSRAANVFANIFSMAESAVIGGNKNLLKLHLFHLAEKYPSDYLSVHKYWYAEAGIDEEGEAVFEAVIPEYSDDPAVYRENVRRFNRRMEEMQLEGRAYPSRSKLNVNLRLLNDEPNEHIVRVRVAGEEYAVLVNGDPRVAQAINGTNDEERTDNRVVKAIRAMNRQMAANFTTRNPAFVVSNLTRDFIFAVTALSVKEGSRYRNRFVRNIPAASGAIRRYLAGNPDYKRKEDVLFDVFLKNGGETGYTALYNIEKYKKLIEREIKNTKRGEAVNAGMKILDFFEAGNRWAEDLSRFSTFMTSRDMGRGVLRSVSDAKEVTVNFNRKGSGANGAQVFRSLYLFFNAAVQSLANFGGMAVKHPKRTAAMLASYAAVGAMVPVFLMAFGGDDALKEYLNLPDYVRKNNLCLYLGGKHGFITIPLPIELRAFYSWGDSFFRYMAGDVAGDTACGEVIMGMLDLLPLNPVGGDTPFMPDALKPITQSFYTNKDFTGRPIARITPYNRYVPEYKRVYRGTGEFFVKSSEVLNYMTGGDYATKGVLDKSGQVLSDLFSADVSVTNPAAIEHLFESYLGGTFTTMNQAMKTVWDLGKLAVTGKNEVEARNVPVLNRFYNTGSLYSSQAKTNEKYFNALDELRETQSRIRRYQEAMGNGEMKLDEATENYGRMVNDGTVERAEVIRFYSGEISKMNQAINSHGLPDEEVDELESEIYLLKEQMLAELEKVKKR